MKNMKNKNKEKRAKILIVDDESRNLRLMNAMLVPLGFEVILARDGEEALRKVKEMPPDLILLDILMPKMDGFEVARRLKQEKETKIIPIVMLTALQEAEYRVKAWEVGADDFLSKPVEKTELRARVRSLLKVKAYNDHIRDYQKKLEAEVTERTKKLRQEITERKKAEKRLLSKQKQLRSLASELSLAEERERRRIAVTLHDSIGQTLALSKIKLGELRELSSSTDISAILEQIYKLIEEAIQETRSLTVELSPPVLYELGFEAALEWLTEHVQDKHGILCDFISDRQPKPLDEDVRVILFQATRELMLNVVKHAKASNVKVSFCRRRDQVRIIVEDDGVGFDPVKIGMRANRARRFGLFSIRERLDYHSGNLQMESNPDQGTRVTIDVPLKHDRKTTKGIVA